jgi:nicotinamide mononucleotide transporter
MKTEIAYGKKNAQKLKQKNYRPLEFLATLLYAASVILFGFNPVTTHPAVFQTAWTLSCAACPLYVAYFYLKRLYSDMLEMGLYIPLNVIGLLGILFYSADFVPPETSFSSTLTIALIITAVGTVVLRYAEKLINLKFPKIFPEPATPWLDSGTTTASLVATILLILWSPATWILWVVIDILAVYVYYKNKSYIVMISYIIYSLNAIRGLINWIQPGIFPF